MGILSTIVKIAVVGTVNKAIDVVKTKVVTKAYNKEKELEIKRIDALEHLNELHDSGAITEREYKKTKKRLLNK